MFGIVAGGRPVGNFERIDEMKFGHVINDASKINYMAVFVLPGVELPSNAAGSVYVQLPNQDFKLLGFLSAEKQSAIFKFNTDQIATTVTNDVDEMMDDDDAAAQQAPTQFDVNVGISLEPLDEAQQQLAQVRMAQAAAPKTLTSNQPAPHPAPKNASDIASLGNKIVENAYNYMSSFTDSQGRVPIKAFNTWWEKFTSRLKSDPNFLDQAT